MGKHSSSSGKSGSSRGSNRNSPRTNANLARTAPLTKNEAREIQASRTPRARAQDAKTDAKKIFDPGTSEARYYWGRHPGRYDLQDIDTTGRGALSEFQKASALETKRQGIIKEFSRSKKGKVDAKPKVEAKPVVQQKLLTAVKSGNIGLRTSVAGGILLVNMTDYKGYDRSHVKVKDVVKGWGAKYDGAGGWKLKDTPENRARIEKLFHADLSKLQGSPASTGTGKTLLEKSSMQLKPIHLASPRFGDVTLKPHQVDLVEHLAPMLQRNGAAMDMSVPGAGKTYVAVALAKEMGLKLIYITTERNIAKAEMLVKEAGLKDANVTNWDLIRIGKSHVTGDGSIQAPFLEVLDEKDPMTKSRFKWDIDDKTLLVFDESHKGKNKGTLQTELMEGAADAKRHGTKVLLTSATPAENPIKFRAQGEMLGLFKGDGFYDWARQYGCKNVPIPGTRGKRSSFEFVGTKADMERLNKDIMGKVAVYKGYDDIPGFPETTISADIFDMGKNTAKIQKAHELFAKELAALKDGENKATNAMALRQKLQQTTEMLKLPAIAGFAKEDFDDGKSVVLFVEYRESARKLMDLLGDDAILHTGDISDKARSEARDLFQADKKRILIATRETAGESVDLHDTHGEHPRVVYMTPNDSGQKMDQAFGRVRRVGGKTPSFQHIVYAAGTVEEQVMKNVSEKLDNLAGLTGELVSPLLKKGVSVPKQSRPASHPIMGMPRERNTIE